MNITRTSDLTGVTRTMDLPITLVQILAWQHGKLVQEAFPQLNADQREFIMTGISAEEWDEIFAEEERQELVDIALANAQDIADATFGDGWKP